MGWIGWVLMIIVSIAARGTGERPDAAGPRLGRRLSGLSGTSGDLRDVLGGRAADDADCALAFDVLVHQLARPFRRGGGKTTECGAGRDDAQVRSGQRPVPLRGARDPGGRAGVHSLDRLGHC
jgi:hypothetical protein